MLDPPPNCHTSITLRLESFESSVVRLLPLSEDAPVLSFRLACLLKRAIASVIALRCVIPAHNTKVASVIGSVQAQKRENLSGSVQPSEGMEKKAAKNVAGRNAMVRTAIVFIDDPSRRAAAASWTLAFAIWMLTCASSCVRRENNCTALLVWHAVEWLHWNCHTTDDWLRTRTSRYCA